MAYLKVDENKIKSYTDFEKSLLKNIIKDLPESINNYKSYDKLCNDLIPIVDKHKNEWFDQGKKGNQGPLKFLLNLCPDKDTYESFLSIIVNYKLFHEIFWSCDFLLEISIPEGLTYIDENAFAVCDNLRDIELPKSLINIQSNAFQLCTSLGSLKIPENVLNIYDHAFSWCTNLKSIDLNTTEYIGDYAFSWCTSLTRIKLPKKLLTISQGLFEKCENLNYVEISAYTNDIQDDAFARCSKLEQLNYLGDKHDWYKFPFLGKNWNRDSNIKTIKCNDGDIQIS